MFSQYIQLCFEYYKRCRKRVKERRTRKKRQIRHVFSIRLTFYSSFESYKRCRKRVKEMRSRKKRQIRRVSLYSSFESYKRCRRRRSKGQIRHGFSIRSTFSFESYKRCRKRVKERRSRIRQVSQCSTYIPALNLTNAACRGIKRGRANEAS